MALVRRLAKPPILVAVYRRGYRSASDKLFADAEREERDDELLRTKERLEQRLKAEENWSGDERVEDAVLRMLIDKYKPLRQGSIQSADAKLKANPPTATQRALSDVPRHPVVSGDVILPGIEGHKPWMTTFKTPSFAVSPAIRNMRLPSPPATKRSQVDESVPVKGPNREERTRVAEANRLVSARERMIDYRFGDLKRPDASSAPEGAKTNPKTMKGWASLVEERIEDARVKGAFNNLKGVGKPIQKSTAESNPFISTEDFLLNGVVQRNGAAPPWVELQQEMETTIATFRQILQSSWVRRAVRTIHLQHGFDPSLVSRFSASYLSSLRDQEWEEKEASYHEHAIKEINSIIRKYNAIAPYAVRRGLCTRKGELERCYSSSGEKIWQELKTVPQGARSSDRVEEIADGEKKTLSLWMQILRAIREMFVRARP